MIDDIVQTMPTCNVCGREAPVCRMCGRCGDPSCNGGCIFCVADTRPMCQRFLPMMPTRPEDRRVPR